MVFIMIETRMRLESLGLSYTEDVVQIMASVAGVVNAWSILRRVCSESSSGQGHYACKLYGWCCWAGSPEQVNKP
jgi:hypothetical protein